MNTDDLNLGAFLAKQKWAQIQRGLPDILHRLGANDRPNETLPWFMFFGLSSELFEAAETMDNGSFEQLKVELSAALAYLGPNYVNSLFGFCQTVIIATNADARRYRFIAASCRTMSLLPLGAVLSSNLPGCDLDAEDLQLDGLELA
jgi:hypothetical protein